MADEKPGASTTKTPQVQNLIVDAKTRFAAAQSEINARITSRATLHVGHIAAIGAITVLFFNLKTGNQLGGDYSPYLASAIPLVSMYFVSLYMHNDTIIGILSAFNRSLEALHESADGESRLPRWFGGGSTPQQENWMKNALEARHWADGSVIGLCAVSPCLVCADAIQELLANGINGLVVSKNFWKLLLPLIVCLFLSTVNIRRLSRVRNNRDMIFSKTTYSQEKRMLISLE